MSAALLNAELLIAIALLIIILLGLSSIQNWSVRSRRIVNWAAPITKWLLGLFIVAYLLFIAFQLQHQSARAPR
jgi:hypothetical protein